jgi:hypothetical protein
MEPKRPYFTPRSSGARQSLCISGHMPSNIEMTYITPLEVQKGIPNRVIFEYDHSTQIEAFPCIWLPYLSIEQRSARGKESAKMGGTGHLPWEFAQTRQFSSIGVGFT